MRFKLFHTFVVCKYYVAVGDFIRGMFFLFLFFLNSRETGREGQILKMKNKSVLEILRREQARLFYFYCVEDEHFNFKKNMVLKREKSIILKCV